MVNLLPSDYETARMLVGFDADGDACTASLPLRTVRRT